MKIFRSMRWKLLLWYGLLLGLILGGLALTAFSFEQSRLLRELDGQLQRRAAILANSLKRSTRGGTPDSPGAGKMLRLSPTDAALFDKSAGYYYAVWLLNGPRETLSPHAPPDIPMPENSQISMRTRGEFREAFLLPAPRDCVLVGHSMREIQASTQRLGWILTGGSIAILVFGLFGGWLLVTRALQPIQSITAAALKITQGDLTQRITTTDSGGELDELASVLNLTFARLDAVFTLQARFTADAAHELRTPITVILTHVQGSLTSEDLSAENRESLEACQRAAQRMRRLVESLLQLSRIDAGQETLHRDRCDLAHIAKDSMEFLRPLADERGITFHPVLDPAICRGDSDLLGQVLTNILSNAIHYGGETRVIHVTTATDGEGITCQITDEGAGIAPEHLPHVFERFYRADKARSNHHGKTGLGLAISKAIIDRHGGKISVESPPGKGATFTVWLPAPGSSEAGSRA